MPEPVAYVTDVFQIVWSGTGPIASMVDRHEITTGTPLITTTQAEAYAEARVREALKEAAEMADDVFAFSVGDSIRALMPKEDA